MRKRRSISLIGLLTLVALLAIALAPGLASAHGKRTIDNKYQFIVGFLNEPAFASQQNGIDLTVCQGECQTNADKTVKNPVKDVDKTLKAEVIFNGQTFPVTLTPRYGFDGKYNGVFFPTQAGDYTFHFTGTINGDAVDERFVSSKDGFNSVEAVAPLQFPATSTSSGPSTADLAQQVKDANDKAGSATIFGIIGIVVGVLGLIVAGISLVMLRSNRAGRPTTPETNLVGSNRG
ncbi:MAG: hypothetical protein J0I20_00385 [Chloroflexi bacterium]|nr:hypothetical protein [Chloroflexota bacterium]